MMPIYLIMLSMLMMFMGGIAGSVWMLLLAPALFVMACVVLCFNVLKMLMTRYD